jgi:chromosome partitioning protein
MIITVGNIKGGVGKTTIAVNLSVARASKGESVVLIDADDQGTATLFTEIREHELDKSDYTCVSVHGAQVRSQGTSLSKKFDHTIIDCGGRDTEAFRAALTICDVLIVPLAPRSFDFWAITQLTRLFDEVESIRDLPKIYALVNMADPTGSDNAEVIEALSEYSQIEVLDNVLVRRKAWPNAASKGLAVFEYSPQDKKANQELEALISKIF